MVGLGLILHLPGFDHDHGDTDNVIVDPAVRDNNLGIITLWVSLGLLWLTTIIQVVIYYYSNSVALLADTGHNFVDAMNSIPLLIAFYLARRAATRRYHLWLWSRRRYCWYLHCVVDCLQRGTHHV